MQKFLLKLMSLKGNRMEHIFKDRHEAGQKLAQALAHYKNIPGVLVLGLPRGGIVVAFEVAKALEVPLDVFAVRKLGIPGHEELAMGAVASGGIRVLNEEIIHDLKIKPQVIDYVTETEHEELKRRERLYRGSRQESEISGRTVILIDDGLATGATMRAAVLTLKKFSPRRIVVAVPVSAEDTCSSFNDLADEVICLVTPGIFFSVGDWYQDFVQVSDDEVQGLMQNAENFKDVRKIA
jgi:putative phosphoribosyl transferase